MPADTYSTIIGVLLQGTGNNNNTWGDNCNSSVFQILEKAITGYSTHAVTGGTLDLSTTTPPAGATSALEFIRNFTGVLASDQLVQVPNVYKTWLVRNATTGSFTLKFKTSAGAASGAIPQGGWAVVWCDGANNCYTGLSTTLRDTQWLGADGAVGAPGLSFSGEGSSGVYRKSAGVIGISILGTEIFEISASGVTVVTGSLTGGGLATVPSGAESAYAGIEAPTGWLFSDGTAYSRATYAALLAAISKTCTGNTNSNTTIDGLSVDLRGKGLEGAKIEGTGISLGTTISTINSATSMTVSQAVSGTNPGVSLRILPFGQGDGSTTFNVPDRRYRMLVGRDDMNNNNAGRSSLYAGKKLATTGGEETHTLSVGEMPSHNHTGSTVAITDPGHTHTHNAIRSLGHSLSAGGFSAPNATPATIDSATTGITATPTIASQGGGSAHNVMAQFGITNWIIKT